MTNGLKVLQYLRESGVTVDEALCAGVPETIVKELGLANRAVYIVNLLSDDKKGVLANHFPDYYNRFPEKTDSAQASELQASFQMFIQQILLGEKARRTNTDHGEYSNEPLAQIEELMNTIREDWLVFSDTYEDILVNMEQLLPLLQKQFTNPILASEAVNFPDGMLDDIIPDEYAEFLHDISVMLCRVYNAKVESIMRVPELWNTYSPLFDQIHHLAISLYYDLNWNIFMLQHKDNSIHSLMGEVLQGMNTVRMVLRERGIQEIPQDVYNPTITYTGLDNPFDPIDDQTPSSYDSDRDMTGQNGENV